ncbi:MAG: glycoside hydrolase family 127 protein [Treponema sp.]|nr:glycoside hydrolase family 127 protein [Treponema sp.]
MRTANAIELREVFPSDGSIHYIGFWEKDGGRRFAGRIYQKCCFTFSGAGVELWVISGPDRGTCEVWLDGEPELISDCYNPQEERACIFKKNDLGTEGLHSLIVVNGYEKNPKSSGFVLEIAGFKAVAPVDYKAELKRQCNTEYAIIQSGEKTWKSCGTWKPVPFAALMPEKGVALTGGLIRRLFDLNIKEIKYDFSIPYYCEGDPKDDLPEEDLRKLPGWSGWLSGSNEGRMLGGAAGVLRWEEDPELRNIVVKIVAGIKARMRDDGYYNYYPEENSYAMVHSIDEWIDRTTWCTGKAEYSERKNYDRVFWTRGLLAAGMAGNKDALELLRRFYDWFNKQEKYLVNMLLGANSTNGLPGGPLVYLSPVGKADDLITSMRYLDQDYWTKALAEGIPLCFVDYPGERPHCYDLLSIETIADEYLATGDEKYLKALIGAWEVFNRYYKHVGGYVAICEIPVPPYSPLSYYVSSHGTGETCGQIFWAWINQRLMQLYPKEEKYVAQIEEMIYNTLVCGRKEGYIGSVGYISLHGKKGGHFHGNSNSCCQVSSSMAVSALPQYIYMTNESTVFVNLFIASRFDSSFGKITMETDFPYSGKVGITVEPLQKAARFDISLRIPYWAEGDTAVMVNGSSAGVGKAGERFTLNRPWEKGDRISFTLVFGPRLYKYTGVDQSPDNKPRYTMLCGPILMAVKDPLCIDGSVITHIDMDADTLMKALKPDRPLHFPVPGTDYLFVPYWELGDEGFTCLPVIKA